VFKTLYLGSSGGNNRAAPIIFAIKIPNKAIPRRISSNASLFLTGIEE
jgi:hypothetical protein